MREDRQQMLQIATVVGAHTAVRNIRLVLRLVRDIHTGQAHTVTEKSSCAQYRVTSRPVPPTMI
jgi:hypothetical protein